MAIDASIPLQAKVPDTIGTLSSLTNLQTARVGLQRQQIAQQQDSTDLQERQYVQGVLSNIKKYQDSSGNIDFNKFVPDVMAGAPTTGAQVISNVAAASSAATNAHAQVNALDAQSRKTVANVLYSLKGQDPKVAASTIDGLKTAYPNLSGATDYFQKYIIGPHMNDPQGFDAAVDSAGKFVQEAPTQQTMNTPDGVSVNDGKTTKLVSTKPGSAVPMGQTVPGTAATLQPGPTTGTVDQSGTPGIIGAQTADFSGVQGQNRGAILSDIASRNPDSQVRQEAANTAAGRPQGFIPQGLPPGQTANIQNNVEEMGRHFGSLQDSAAGNQLVQGLTGNIRALADKAATGVGGDRKAYMAGLLNAFGLGNEATGDVEKDSALLNKQMAQLNLGTPASTDAMRTLIEAGRPSSKMPASAIKEAADQVASQVQANMAMRNVLSGYKMMGDVKGYNDTRQKLEQVADPRAWQYVNMGPGSPEAKAFMSKLQPADRAALIQKVDQLEQMGLLK